MKLEKRGQKLFRSEVSLTSVSLLLPSTPTPTPTLSLPDRLNILQWDMAGVLSASHDTTSRRRESELQHFATDTALGTLCTVPAPQSVCRTARERVTGDPRRIQRQRATGRSELLKVRVGHCTGAGCVRPCALHGHGAMGCVRARCENTGEMNELEAPCVHTLPPRNGKRPGGTNRSASSWPNLSHAPTRPSNKVHHPYSPCVNRSPLPSF